MTGMYEMALERSSEPGFELVAVAGPADHYTCGDLRDLLLSLDRDGVSRIVIDLRNAEYLDSTALGVLIGGLKRAFARHGFVDLVTVEDRHLKLFKITGLMKMFRIHQSLAAAREYRRQRAEVPVG